MILNTLLLQHTAAACTGCFWCWAIWMLLSAMLGLFIGKWIWGKYATIVAQKEKELKALKDRNSQVEKDFVAAKYQIDELEKDNKGLKASLANFQSEIVSLGTQLSRLRIAPQKDVSSPNPPTPENIEPITIEESSNTPTEITEKEESEKLEVTVEKTTNQPNPLDEVVKQAPTVINPPVVDNLNIYTTYLKDNDLKIIEGVGPKIEDILNKEGYKNWTDIANSKVEDLKNIMHDAGPRYRIHNPATWNQQAKMALKGDWDNLIDLQKILSSKRTGEEIESSIPKIEKLIAKKIGFESIIPRDLKIIEGIGPKIEELLKANGIANWEKLSKTPLAILQTVLSEAGERYKLADPTTWSKQATLAHQKEWIKLKEFQAALSGGSI